MGVIFSYQKHTQTRGLLHRKVPLVKTRRTGPKRGKQTRRARFCVRTRACQGERFYSTTYRTGGGAQAHVQRKHASKQHFKSRPSLTRSALAVFSTLNISGSISRWSCLRPSTRLSSVSKRNLVLQEPSSGSLWQSTTSLGGAETFG